MILKNILKRPNFQLTLLILISSAIIFFRYQAIFQNLSTNKTIEIYRDGIKTVLNATYHAKYSNSYAWFSGMNYPYQEHIMAATELPGMAILFKFLYPYFPWVTDYAFGITHLFLLSSIVLGCIFIYLIFKELGLPYYLTIPFSIAVTFLAPQNMRLFAHLGLAPLFVLPSVLYFLLKYEKTRHWKYSAFLGLATFIGAFMHFYFFAIIAIFVSLYFLVMSLEKPENKGFIKKITNLGVQYFLGIGIPLLFFFYWMILNDTVTDRTPNPWGFFVYNSNFSNLFSSPHLPIYEWIDKRWFQEVSVDFEGWSYIGLVADVFLIAILIKWIIGLFKKNILHFIPNEHRAFLIRLLVAGGIMGYLSCSQPFIMKGWEYLLEYTGPYKQFRSTGRFAWAFYFSINIIAFTGFYYLLKTIKNKAIKIVLFTFIIGISLYEAYTFHTNGLVYQDYDLRYAPELEPGHEFTKVTDIDFSKYQAIVPSPIFLVGSNNFERPGSAYIIQQALVLSSQTGLPVTGAMLTRSSHRQGMNQMQLVTEPYRMPVVFEEYENKKPLLLLVSFTEQPAFDAQFRHLKDGAILLDKNERWSLYELPLESFKNRIEQQKMAILSEIKSDKLHTLNGLLSNKPVVDFVYDDFDQLAAQNPYLGEGCYEGETEKINTLFKGKLPNPRTDLDYTVQLWVDALPDRFSQTVFQVKETLANGHINLIGQTNPAWGSMVFDDNGWVMLEIPFRISGPESVVTLTFFKEDEYQKRIISVDELLIKPIDTQLYQTGKGFIWKNNRYYLVDDGQHKLDGR